MDGTQMTRKDRILADKKNPFQSDLSAYSKFSIWQNYIMRPEVFPDKAFAA
jgi:hypothetical protein